LLPSGLVPHRMELRVFSPELRICGSIDGLFYHPRRKVYYMIDWKRAKAIRRQAFQGKRGKGPCAGMPDCNFSHYALQQNLYKWMLERGTNGRITIAHMFLAVFHPTHDAWECYTVPDESETLRAMLAVRAEQLGGSSSSAAAPAV